MEHIFWVQQDPTCCHHQDSGNTSLKTSKDLEVLAFFLLLMLSTLLTLWPASLSDILAVLRFAPIEMEALQGIPLQGSHLAILIGLPLLLTLVALMLSRRHFQTAGPAINEQKASARSTGSIPNQEVSN